jgi:hypothetical protein
MANKKNTKIENKFLNILLSEFGNQKIMDDVYKIAVCNYLDGTSDCILIHKKNKHYDRLWNWGRNLYNIKGNNGISLESVVKIFNFDHIILEPRHFWERRRSGCENCKYIK